jgi:hypothetical protein
MMENLQSTAVAREQLRPGRGHLPPPRTYLKDPLGATARAQITDAVAVSAKSVRVVYLILGRPGPRGSRRSSMRSKLMRPSVGPTVRSRAAKVGICFQATGYGRAIFAHSKVEDLSIMLPGCLLLRRGTRTMKALALIENTSAIFGPEGSRSSIRHSTRHGLRLLATSAMILPSSKTPDQLSPSLFLRLPPTQAAMSGPSNAGPRNGWRFNTDACKAPPGACPNCNLPPPLNDVGGRR